MLKRNIWLKASKEVEETMLAGGKRVWDMSRANKGQVPLRMSALVLSIVYRVVV